MIPSRIPPPRWRPLALAAGWLGLTWLTLIHGLASFGLLGKDEPRYAAIAAAMLERRDFVTPWLWGHPWLEKPVLYYWLAAAAGAIHGFGDTAARVPNALLAAALCASLGCFLRRVHSTRAGVLAAFISASSAFVIAFGRAATTDMTLTAPLCWAAMCLYLWFHHRRPRWVYLAAVFLALATLAKGPVGVLLPGLALLLWIAGQRRWRDLPSAGVIATAAALFLAVAAPWYIAVSLRNPEFPRVFFLQHNLERFATNRYNHPQPFWFYLPVLLGGLFPWTGWLAFPLPALWRRWRTRAPLFSALDAYLWLWLAVPMVFFSLSQSKLPGYLLPAMPAAVALIAVAAAERWHALPRWPLALSAVLAGALPAAVRVLPDLLGGARFALLRHDTATIETGAATIAILGLLVLRRRPALVAGATCLLVAGAVFALTRPPLSWDVDESLGVRSAVFALHQASHAPIAAFRLDDAARFGLEYYLNRELPDWRPTGADTVVVLDKHAAAALIRACTGCKSLRVLAGQRTAAPWMAVQVRYH